MTTVGYGDNVPTDRSPGSSSPCSSCSSGIGFLTVITAAITSTFVARSRARCSRRRTRAATDEQLRRARPPARADRGRAPAADAALAPLVLERSGRASHERDVPIRDDAQAPPGSRRLAVLLAMAMFVLVVDTSLMNVSISAVVDDLDTTVSGVQSAIALEALVSAAFILIGSKVGDLIGRKRAFVTRPARLRARRAGDDAGAEPDRDHHLLGDHRRARRVAAAAGDAVADPRQLRGRGAEEGLRAGRRRGRDRGRRRAAARRLHHDLPVVARRVRARGRRHRDRAQSASGSSTTCRTPARASVDIVGARAVGRRHGRRRASASSSGRRAASTSAC